MKNLLAILTICGMALCHTATCQDNPVPNRFTFTLKRPHKRPTKMVYVHVKGVVSGSISRDSLLNDGKVSIVDKQKRFKRMKVIAFQMVLERQDSKGDWQKEKTAKTFSYFDGDTFSDEMLSMIKRCGKSERIVIYVTDVYNGPTNVGYSARVCLSLR